MGYGGQVGGEWGFGDFPGKKMGCIEVEGVGYRGGKGGVWGSCTPLSSPPEYLMTSQNVNIVKHVMRVR